MINCDFFSNRTFLRYLLLLHFIPSLNLYLLTGINFGRLLVDFFDVNKIYEYNLFLYYLNKTYSITLPYSKFGRIGASNTAAWGGWGFNYPGFNN